MKIQGTPIVVLRSDVLRLTLNLVWSFNLYDLQILILNRNKTFKTVVTEINEEKSVKTSVGILSVEIFLNSLNNLKYEYVPISY